MTERAQQENYDRWSETISGAQKEKREFENIKKYKRETERQRKEGETKEKKERQKKRKRDKKKRETKEAGAPREKKDKFEFRDCESQNNIEILKIRLFHPQFELLF